MRLLATQDKKNATKILSAFILAGVSVLEFAAVALADEIMTGEVIGDWRYECKNQAAGEQNCALIQTVIDRGANDVVVRLSFAIESKNNRVFVSALVPLGVDLSEGAFVNYDYNRVGLPFRMCLIHGCLARHALDIEALKTIAQSDELSVQFFAIGLAEPAQVMASSYGLNDALQRLGLLTDD